MLMLTVSEKDYRVRSLHVEVAENRTLLEMEPLVQVRTGVTFIWLFVTIISRKQCDIIIIGLSETKCYLYCLFKCKELNMRKGGQLSFQREHKYCPHSKISCNKVYVYVCELFILSRRSSFMSACNVDC